MNITTLSTSQKPHIAKVSGSWTCGIYSVAIGCSAVDAWRKWAWFKVDIYAHTGVAEGKTWREYVKGEAPHL